MTDDGIDVELLGDDLRDDGLGAVAPHRLRVQRDDDLAGRVDLQARALGARGRRELRLVEPEPELRRAEDAALLRGDDADADVPPLGARAFAARRPSGRSRPPRAPSRARPGSCRCRRCSRSACGTGTESGRDQVAAADLDAVDVEVAGREVDEPLEHPVARPRRRSRGRRPAGSCSSAPRRASTRRAGSGTGPTICESALPCVPVPNWRYAP